jgi:hypothetical protein
MLESRAADRIDNLIRHEDTRTTVSARCIAAMGDPAYTDAFITMLKDPMSGHLRMSNRIVSTRRCAGLSRSKKSAR